jgi:energy-coupling factor transporter ATP-binding protein EcfA2
MTCLADKHRNITGPEDGLPSGQPVFSYSAPLAIYRAFRHKPAMLQISDLTFRMMGRPLFEGATAVVPEGMKVGLVGRNGTGKTTLFKMMTGELAPESGSIELPKGLRIGQVAQEAPGTEQTLLEVVLAADLERTALLAEAETATDPDRIAAIHVRLADIDAHSAEARAGAILHGLGFDAQAQATALLVVFRRLADARRARRRAVFTARSADARRADQLSRSGRHAVAGKLRPALSAHRHHHQP